MRRSLTAIDYLFLFVFFWRALLGLVFFFVGVEKFFDQRRFSQQFRILDDAAGPAAVFFTADAGFVVQRIIDHNRNLVSGAVAGFIAHWVIDHDGNLVASAGFCCLAGVAGAFVSGRRCDQRFQIALRDCADQMSERRPGIKRQAFGRQRSCDVRR